MTSSIWFWFVIVILFLGVVQVLVEQWLAERNADDADWRDEL